MDKIKFFTAIIGGAVSAYFKAYIPLIAIVAVAAVFDMITGVVAAVCTGEGINSKKAMRGALKKATMFLALGFGTFLDYLIPQAAAMFWRICMMCGAILGRCVTMMLSMFSISYPFCRSRSHTHESSLMLSAPA